MNNKIRNMSYCAMFAIIVAILSQIRIVLPSLVPITMQTLGIYLIGCMLKPRLALFASLLYIFIGLCGFPVFSGTSSGLAVLVGPTGGYIFSFPIVAFLISLIVSKHDTNYYKIIALILGTMVCYTIGTLWFMVVTSNNLITSLSLCVLPFLLGDIIKIIITLIISNKINIKS